MAPSIIYLLCAITSFLCTVLLLRNYFKKRVGLLLWSGLCFIGLTLNNIILVVDTTVLPEIDLSLIRIIPAFLGMAVLAFGLIWEAL